MTTAFLSALGMMGRRHLRGLVRAGYRVTAFDPNAASAAAARAELEADGLPAERLDWVPALPTGRFDLAIFAETTAHRFRNLAAFLDRAAADRILLEKPLSADPAEVAAFAELLRGRGLLDRVAVNFPRRAWPCHQQLASLCAGSSGFDMTLNGGAIGLGCNGIHYLDLFLYLAGGEPAEVRFARLSPQRIASGRGAEFEDFGGSFLLEGRRGVLFAALSADSSATVTLTVRGDGFKAWLDEADRTWRLAARDPASTLPNYRYGADYRVLADGRAEAPALDEVTARWSRGEISLPGLESALAAHALLDRILRAGGATPPYRYT